MLICRGRSTLDGVVMIGRAVEEPAEDLSSVTQRRGRRFLMGLGCPVRDLGCCVHGLWRKVGCSRSRVPQGRDRSVVVVKPSAVRNEKLGQLQTQEVPGNRKRGPRRLKTGVQLFQHECIGHLEIRSSAHIQLSFPIVTPELEIGSAIAADAHRVVVNMSGGRIRSGVGSDITKVVHIAPRERYKRAGTDWDSGFGINFSAAEPESRPLAQPIRVGRPCCSSCPRGPYIRPNKGRRYRLHCRSEFAIMVLPQHSDLVVSIFTK